MVAKTKPNPLVIRGGGCHVKGDNVFHHSTESIISCFVSHRIGEEADGSAVPLYLIGCKLAEVGQEIVKPWILLHAFQSQSAQVLVIAGDGGGNLLIIDLDLA